MGVGQGPGWLKHWHLVPGLISQTSAAFRRTTSTWVVSPLVSQNHRFFFFPTTFWPTCKRKQSQACYFYSIFIHRSLSHLWAYQGAANDWRVAPTLVDKPLLSHRTLLPMSALTFRLAHSEIFVTPRLSLCPMIFSIWKAPISSPTSQLHAEDLKGQENTSELKWQRIVTVSDTLNFTDKETEADNVRLLVKFT